MTNLMDEVRILLRALPYLHEVVLPLAGAVALTTGVLTGRLLRSLRKPPPRRPSRRAGPLVPR